MLNHVILAVVIGTATAASAVEASPMQMAEHAAVAKEACGSDPSANCLSELRKVCHAHLTFRCYYSRKDRLDAVIQVGFPDDRHYSRDE